MKLIPQPQRLEQRAGAYRLRYSDRITMDVSCPVNVYETACLLANEVREETGFELMVDRRGSGAHRGIHLRVCSKVGDGEAYTMEICENGVTITGADEAGLHYGVQTLRQMIRQAGCVLPCLKIWDHPDLAVRGLFYDVTRGRIPTMEFLEDLVDRCSFYKMNQLHLYIEHTFLFDGLSEVWRDDTPLTSQDILELDAYCRKRHVDLVPSVASLGHLYKVLRTRTYSHLAELEEQEGAEFSFYNRMAHHTLDVTQAESLELVYRMIDEYVSLFTSDLFNLNGDEPFDLGRGKGKPLADQIGSHQMYVDWIAKVCTHVKELGKRPMFWGDVILADPDTMKELPRDIICMNWDYAPDYREDHARKLAATGAAQYLCPGAQGWKRLINRFDNAYKNIWKMATLAHKYNGEGLLVTEWGDYGHLQDPESSMPGIIYAAAMGWNRNIPGEAELNEAVSVVEYGDPTGKIMSVLGTLCRQTVMDWDHVVEYAEIRRGRLLEKTMEQYRDHYQTRIEARLPLWQEMEKTADACLEEMGRLMPAMAGRKRMMAYFVMAEGQKLMNRYAVVINGGEGVDAKVLASDLEVWYNDYKNLWRRGSRESELYRIGEMIFWMADDLRENL